MSGPSSIRGDVSLKDMPWSLDGESSGAHWSSGSHDSEGDQPPPRQSPSKASLLNYGDDETMDEFDAACSILNELQYKGLISKEEKQRRKRLVMSYMEFAASDYAVDPDGSSSHSWGPFIEMFRSILRCLRCCCCLSPSRPQPI